MNDFQEGPDNFNNVSDNSNPPGTKKPNTLFDVLMGIGISAIAYAFIWLAVVVRIPTPIQALIDFIILAAAGFFTVKFFRTSHTAAAITILVLIAPAILALLVLGACALIFLPKFGLR